VNYRRTWSFRKKQIGQGLKKSKTSKSNRYAVSWVEFKPDLIITENGISGAFHFHLNYSVPESFLIDLAQHILSQNNISAIRLVRKSDNNRIAPSVGATIVNRVEVLRETDVGTKCGVFYIKKTGDE